MTTVKIDKLTRHYGSTVAVQDLTLDIASGEMVALLGPSGCGKTTTLRMVSGLLNPTQGDVLFDGQSVLGIPTEKRGAVMVFQKQLLFPTMTVRQNVGFGLRMAKQPKAEIAAAVDEMLERVQLGGYGDRRAHELSGGQQQRVALARALAVRPKVLLLDEPLANLDANLRVDMRAQIRDVQRELGITTIFVTHDQEEAVMLADRVALMVEGELLQVGAPQDFYRRPASAQVATFFRNNNRLRGVLDGTRIVTDVGTLNVLPDQVTSPAGPVTVTVRPEAIELGAGDNSIRGLVKAAIYMGTHTHLQVDVDGSLWDVHANVADHVSVGNQIDLRLPPAAIWTF